MTEETLVISHGLKYAADHHELAVHTICHAAVTRDTISEILDFESALKTTGKETTEGGDEGGECCEDEDVELDWSDNDRVGDWEEFAERVDERGCDFEFSGDKDGIGGAIQS